MEWIVFCITLLLCIELYTAYFESLLPGLELGGPVGVPPVVLRRIERRFDLRARLEVTEALGMMRPAPIFPPEVTLRRRGRKKEVRRFLDSLFQKSGAAI
jgi:hypothetical protein